ncbi:uncharacterized protein LOC115823731 [Chanos chanos]|uniref:Uncharacterized protein LOC115823731 n=1 Tax=Chanos chanos TaxID=29144 RepID=A0A6J2WH24_CHACN|nr:uncharacterized protein LOC115823731 [Chanos chanos]
MDRPITFRSEMSPLTRIKHGRVMSPAPSCVSMKSDQSMDRPIAFSEGDEPQKIPSPCLSLRSNQSMDRPITFRSEMSPLTRIKHGRVMSPAPSCVSMKSDQSMDRPIAFSEGDEPQKIPSPCLSLRSNQSMDRPITFRSEMSPFTGHQLEQSVSPSSGCLSPQSDQSKDRPVAYCKGFPRVKLDKIPLPCPSLRSDQSMDRPLAFRQEVYSPDISDLTASLLTEDHFRCSVCTEVLKNPVSIPCGHSYCRTCIETYWDKPDQTGGYACPQCRKRSRTRPVLYTNSVLALVVQKLQQAGFSPALPAHCYAGPGDVACDFCTEGKLKAVKSCLTCIVSLCENHVRQHYTIPALQRHSLVEVNENLEQKLCQQHQRALEVFCKTDHVFVCRSCAMEEHKNHEIIYPKKEDDMVSRRTLGTFTGSISLILFSNMWDYSNEYSCVENMKK